MPTPSSRQKGFDKAQDDPGVSNDPRSSVGGYDQHIWTSLNQIFERLGKIDQKLDQAAVDQKTLKDSVEKHDKIIARVGFTVAGAVLVIGVIWFIYSNFLKDHIAIK